MPFWSKITKCDKNSLLSVSKDKMPGGRGRDDPPMESAQGCALAEPGGPWRLTFALGRLENHRFFIQIICWAPQILQIQRTGLPSIFLRAQPCSIFLMLSHRIPDLSLASLSALIRVMTSDYLSKRITVKSIAH